MIEIVKLGEPLGAEVRGIDPRQPLSPPDAARVHAAFLEHLVLRFRAAPLTARQFRDFAAHFGTLQPHIAKRYSHPEVNEIVFMTNRDGKGEFDEVGAKRGLGWHSALAYEQAPANATLLHGVALPSRGGNTAFANMYLAYARMPAALKARLDGRYARFRYGGRHKVNLGAISKADQERPDVVHPVIRTHPETGRKSVYVNPYHTYAITGMSLAESDALLSETYEWCARPEFQWEQVWQPGDTIIWENRSAWHTVRLDYPLDEERTFFRTTVLGERTLDAATVERALAA